MWLTLPPINNVDDKHKVASIHGTERFSLPSFLRLIQGHMLRFILLWLGEEGI